MILDKQYLSKVSNLYAISYCACQYKEKFAKVANDIKNVCHLRVYYRQEVNSVYIKQLHEINDID